MNKPVDFTYIRYANCWEDADLLVQNTEPFAHANILSIASAGDNSLAFLAFEPKMVLSFDINPTQLYLTELKQKAIQYLTYGEVLSFLGFDRSRERLKIFQRVSPHLSEEARNYLNNHIELIKNGIIHQGKFENYFALFRKYVLPLIHSKRKIDALFIRKTAREQQKFYDHEWNTWRWRLLFRVFFSKYVLGKYGRDPRFFDQTKEDVSASIFERAETHLRSTLVSQNHYLDYQLRGNFSVNLPFYLRPENFECIKRNINKLQLCKGMLTDLPVEQKFDILNLSNIFEYMDEENFMKQADFLPKISNANARIAYWNLLVDRSLPSNDPRYKDQTIHGKDMCFFYKSFHLNTVTT